jgi:Holliday junction resolvase RusA-like endonuclease
MEHYLIYMDNIPFVAGLERPRVSTRGGYVREYDTPNNKWRKAIIQEAYREECRKKYGDVYWAPKGTKVYIRIETFSALPKSRPKKVDSEPDVFKPDIDNIGKLVLDALNGVAYVDDVQVVVLDIRKNDRQRGIEPHMEVTVRFSMED